MGMPMERKRCFVVPFRRQEMSSRFPWPAPIAPMELEDIFCPIAGRDPSLERRPTGFLAAQQGTLAVEAAAQHPQEWRQLVPMGHGQVPVDAG